MDEKKILTEAADLAAAWRRSLTERPVASRSTTAELRGVIPSKLADEPLAADVVVRELAAALELGAVATGGPRYFGFVVGGAHPAALAADWLVSAFDQNAGLVALGPSVSVLEEIAGRWVGELLGFPSNASFAFVTGAQMAHFTALAAARHHVLAGAGWDLPRDGLFGSPPIRVIVGQERHVTVDRALRYLGIGSASIVAVAADDQDRMQVAGLERALADSPGPTIVCAQLGSVNTGACDDLVGIAALTRSAHAWLHVDGAFGAWAAVSPQYRHLASGLELADSVSVDAHKWLNVPYDCAMALVAHPASHHAAMSVHADYLEHDERGDRDQVDWTPEFSRRARSLPVYAVLRSLGRSGLANLIERSCRQAVRFANHLAAAPQVRVLNDVVLNQVLVRFGDDDRRTQEVLRRVQADGTCWMSGTTWNGQAAMRISLVNSSTTDDDVDRSAEAILRIASSLA